MPNPRFPHRHLAVARAQEVGCPEAAREYGVTDQAVRLWCKQAGVTPRRLGTGRPAGQPETWPIGQHRDGSLDCLCWCQRSIVRVQPADVLAGRTLSCGTNRCTRKAA